MGIENGESYVAGRTRVAKFFRKQGLQKSGKAENGFMGVMIRVASAYNGYKEGCLMGDNILTIATIEASEAAGKTGTVEVRLRRAMHAVVNHWALTDDGERLRAAVSGTAMVVDDADKKRLTDEWEALGILSSAFSGVPVDFDKVPKLQNLVGIMKLWREVKGA